MQRLFLLVGHPGAGKTTVSHIIGDLTGAEHIWADRERRHRFGTPRYTHEENVQLYESLNQQTTDLLAAGNSVIFDTNFNFYKDRQALRAIADKHGVRTTIIHLTTPRELAKHRATQLGDEHHTRVLGAMPEHEFERIAGNLQPPQADEDTIEIDGIDVSVAHIKQLLEL